jgi:hypothetical protein
MNGAVLARVQKAARYGHIKLGLHGGQEATAANAQAADIKNAICTATRAIEQNEGKILLEGGTDLDGVELVVVVRETPYGLSVITVF